MITFPILFALVRNGRTHIRVPVVRRLSARKNPDRQRVIWKKYLEMAYTYLLLFMGRAIRRARMRMIRKDPDKRMRDPMTKRAFLLNLVLFPHAVDVAHKKAGRRLMNWVPTLPWYRPTTGKLKVLTKILLIPTRQKFIKILEVPARKTIPLLLLMAVAHQVRIVPSIILMKLKNLR